MALRVPKFGKDKDMLNNPEDQLPDATFLRSLGVHYDRLVAPRTRKYDRALAECAGRIIVVHCDVCNADYDQGGFTMKRIINTALGIIAAAGLITWALTAEMSKAPSEATTKRAPTYTVTAVKTESSGMCSIVAQGRNPYGIVVQVRAVPETAGCTDVGARLWLGTSIPGTSDRGEDISTLLPSLVRYEQNTGTAKRALRQRLQQISLDTLEKQTGLSRHTILRARRGKRVHSRSLRNLGAAARQWKPIT
jgi:hypothetical protein